MDLTKLTVWSHLLFKIYETAMMVDDDDIYSKDEIIENLLEMINLLENAKP